MPRSPKTPLRIVTVRTRDGNDFYFSFAYGDLTINWNRYLRDRGQVLYKRAEISTARGPVSRQVVNPRQGFTRRLIVALEKKIEECPIAPNLIVEEPGVEIEKGEQEVQRQAIPRGQESQYSRWIYGVERQNAGHPDQWNFDRDVKAYEPREGYPGARPECKC